MPPNTRATMAHALGLVVGLWLTLVLPVPASAPSLAPLWSPVLVSVVVADVSTKWSEARGAAVAVRLAVPARCTRDGRHW